MHNRHIIKYAPLNYPQTVYPDCGLTVSEIQKHLNSLHSRIRLDLTRFNTSVVIYGRTTMILLRCKELYDSESYYTSADFLMDQLWYLFIMFLRLLQS